jgi:hypothetical protein
MADRVKHRIVKFTDGRARVYITDDIANLVEDENTLINPDMSYVRGVSPEHWALKDGKLWPIEDEAQIAAINAEAAVSTSGFDIKKVEILQRIERNEKAIAQQAKSTEDGIFSLYNEINAKIGGVIFDYRDNDEQLIKSISALGHETEHKLRAIKEQHKKTTTILGILIGLLAIGIGYLANK